MDTWTDRLSEYLDGTLSGSERAALEAHLAGCAACAATLDELRRVVTRARGLEDRPPAADLWPGIAERIGVQGGGGAAALPRLAPPRRGGLPSSAPKLFPRRTRSARRPARMAAPSRPPARPAAEVPAARPSL